MKPNKKPNQHNQITENYSQEDTIAIVGAVLFSHTIVLLPSDQHIAQKFMTCVLSIIPLCHLVQLLISWSF